MTQPSKARRAAFSCTEPKKDMKNGKRTSLVSTARERLPRGSFLLLVWLLASSAAYAQFQTITIQVGAGPVALALNQATHLLYVANESSGSVSVIDTNPANATFNTVVAGPIPVGTTPYAIAVNEATNRIYVANSGSASITVIDGASNTPIATIPLGIGKTTIPPTCPSSFNPDSLAINPNTNQIYVGDASCAFAAIDGNTNTVRYPDPSGLGAEIAVGVNTASNMIYVASRDDSDIEMFNENTTGGVFGNTLQTGFNANQPIALAVDSAQRRIYVADLTGLVEVIDEATKQEIANTNCISPVTGQPTTCFGIATPGTPYAVAVNPNTGKAYVLNQSGAGGPATLSVVNSSLNNEIISANITVGASLLPVRIPAAYKVLVDPAGNLVYVANDGSNSVTVVDGNTDTILFTFPTGSQPFALAKDAATGDVYVANFTAGTPGTITVLTSVSSNPNLLSSTSLNFGPQGVGTSSPAQLLTLFNRGPGSLTVSSIIPTGDFSETDNCLTGAIAVGGSCTIQVTFTPSATGTRTGQLTIHDSDPSSPQMIGLSGAGISAGTATTAGVTVAPSALTFGSQMLGTFSGSLAVTVTNNAPAGGPSLLFTNNSTNNSTNDFNLDNGCNPNPPATTLQIPPGSSCTIEVYFQPGATGSRSDQLTITDFSTTGITGAGVTYSVPLSGTGIPAQGVRLLASSMVFGSQLVGTSSPGQVETLTNLGFTNLSVSGYAATGDFAITADNCIGTVVAAGTSCELIVTFNPTRAGTRTGQILVYDNQNYSPQTITLSGTGTPLGVTLAPSTLGFGAQLSNANQGVTRSVTLTNTGTSNLTISSITVGGDEGFVETDNCQSPANGPVAPGGACTITLTNVLNTLHGFTANSQVLIVDSDPSSPHFVVLTASGGPSFVFAVSPSFLSAPAAVSVSDTLFQPLISKVQAIGSGWGESDTCSPPAFTLTSCTVNVTGGTGAGQITIDDVNHLNVSPVMVSLAGPYDITNLMNTPANSQPGSQAVIITPLDTTTGTQPVTLTFPSGSITKGGITTLTTQPIGPAPPSGFQFGNPPVYYYIQTTAVFSGNVTICITSPAVTSTSHLYHFSGAGSTDITVMPVTPPTICGLTTSFSPFAIAQPSGKTATSLGLTSSANPSVAGQSVTFTAAFGGTGFPPAGAPAPTGSVTFLDGSTQIGSPMSLPTSGAIAITLSTLTAGTHSVTAQYSGDSNYAGSTSSPITQTVNLTATSLALMSSADPSVVGQAVTFTSTLSGTGAVPPGVPAPGGTITFTVDGVLFGSPESLSSEAATISTNSLAAGSHTVSAQYSGDGNYAPSNSSVVTQTVNKNSTATTLSSSALSAALGQAITLNSMVSNAGTGSLPPGLPVPSGFVTFFDGNTALGSPVTLPASGPAMLTLTTLTAGTHTLTAQYSGDAFYSASTSTSVQVTITNNATSTVLTSSGSSVYGQSVTFTADVTALGGGTPGGSVAFFDSTTATSLGSSVLSPSGVATVATSSLAAGIHSITATYAGNGTLTASTSSPLPQTVSPAPLAITAVLAVGNNVFRFYGANNQSIIPAVTGLVNGDVISATDMTSAAPSSPVGVYPVTPALSDPANRLGNYAVTIVNGTLTVVPENTSLTVAAAPASIVVGQSSTVTIALSAPDMVIPIDPSVLAAITLTSSAPTDVLSNGGMCTPLPGASPGTASCTLTITSVDPNGRTLTANFPGSADLAGSTGTAQLMVTEPVQGQQSCIASDFRNVAVPGGSYIWFNSIFRIRDVSKQVVHITFANSTVQFQYTDGNGNVVPVSLQVPGAQIVIDPGVSVASTSFDPVNNVWHTTLPWDLDDNAFLSGMPWLVPAAGLPADVEPVTLCGTFAVDVAGAHLGWRWAAAAYSSAFNANNPSLGVKPMDTDGDNPGTHPDLAGTPENYKQFVIPGARGKGGANYTGSYTRSDKIE